MSDKSAVNKVDLYDSFADASEANAAVSAFMDELGQLRAKHGIANVGIVVKDRIEGQGSFMACGYIGYEIEQEAMAAYYFGQASAQARELVRRATEEGGESVRSNRGKQSHLDLR